MKKKGAMHGDLEGRICPDFRYSLRNLLSSSCSLTFSRYVMNIEWDYNYYQPWSDNEWLVDKMLAMLDEDIIMQ